MIELPFDQKSFISFLGPAQSEQEHFWGKSKRYTVTSTKLLVYERQLAATIYTHHSSFDFGAELHDLGYPHTAAALGIFRGGLPGMQHLATQMGSLAEVLGVEYAKHLMDFNTTAVFPKRYNPNINQSMKGVDIIGIRVNCHPSILLLGEAKGYTAYSKDIIQGKRKPRKPGHTDQREVGPIENLRTLSNLGLSHTSQLLFHWREMLKNEGNKLSVDRIFEPDHETQLLFFLLTFRKPRQPFKEIDIMLAQAHLPFPLTAVHIQLEALRGEGSKANLRRKLLSALFTPNTS
jgi:hypothetical protein